MHPLPNPGANHAGQSALSYGQGLDTFLQNRQINQGTIANNNANAAFRNAQAQAEPINAQAAYQRAMAEQMRQQQAEIQADRNYGLDQRKYQLDVDKFKSGQQKTDPLEQLNYMAKVYATAPEGSPQKAYAGRFIQQQLTGYGAPAPHSTGQGGGMGGGQVGGQVYNNIAQNHGLPPDMSVNPHTVNSRGSLKGTDIIGKNPDGTYTSYESATSAAQSQNQNRLSAEAELSKLWPHVETGIEPYIGSYLDPLIQFNTDVIKAKKGDKEAERRLEGLNVALRIADETAMITARMATGGVPTEGVYQNILKDQLGNLAGYKHMIEKSMPHKYAKLGLKKYQGIQTAGVHGAVDAQRGGYQRTTNEKPYFETQGQQAPFELEVVSGETRIKPMGAQPRAQAAPNAAPPQQAPKWNHSDDDYQAWKKSQGLK